MLKLVYKGICFSGITIMILTMDFFYLLGKIIQVRKFSDKKKKITQQQYGGNAGKFSAWPTSKKSDQTSKPFLEVLLGQDENSSSYGWNWFLIAFTETRVLNGF